MTTALPKSTSYFPEENRLLAALPEAAHRRLQSQMELMRLPSGRVLFEAGESVAHVFFQPQVSFPF